MFFERNDDSLFTFLKLEKYYAIVTHKLGGDRSADQSRELVSAQRNVLLDLYHVEAICLVLRLYGKNIVRTTSIHSYIDFIRLDLSKLWSCGA